MATLEERFKKGMEVRTRIGGGTPASSVPVTNEMAPDLHQIAAEALFGSIWTRTALAVEQREMCTLSVLTVLERVNQLRAHIGGSLNQGLTPEQIMELFVHLALYGGFPASFNAIELAKEVFDGRGIVFTAQRVHDPAGDPEALYQKGLEKRRELMGDPLPGSGDVSITNAEREFNRLTTEYLWGSIWTRPVLDMQSRSLCTLSALVALGRERQLRSHIRGALRIGFTQEQIIEIFMHTTFYAGLPAARTAIDIANEVFRPG